MEEGVQSHFDSEEYNYYYDEEEREVDSSSNSNTKDNSEEIANIHRDHKKFWASNTSTDKEECLGVLDQQLFELREQRILRSSEYIIIGRGSPQAEIVFIMESPGEKELGSGVPFCNASAILLIDRAHAAFGSDKCYFMYIFPFRTREKAVYSSSKNRRNSSNNNDSNNEHQQWWGRGGGGGGGGEAEEEEKKSNAPDKIDMGVSEINLFLYYAIRRILIIRPKFIVGFGKEVSRYVISGFDLKVLKFVPNNFKELLSKYLEKNEEGYGKENKEPCKPKLEKNYLLRALPCVHPFSVQDPSAGKNKYTNRREESEKQKEQRSDNIYWWFRCFEIIDDYIFPKDTLENGGTSAPSTVNAYNMLSKGASKEKEKRDKINGVSERKPLPQQDQPNGEFDLDKLTINTSFLRGKKAPPGSKTKKKVKTQKNKVGVYAVKVSAEEIEEKKKLELLVKPTETRDDKKKTKKKRKSSKNKKNNNNSSDDSDIENKKRKVVVQKSTLLSFWGATKKEEEEEEGLPVKEDEKDQSQV